MEIPYFVKELLELSLMMRAKEQWEETNAKKGTIFWQPWLDRGIFYLFFFYCEKYKVFIFPMRKI